ncbi:MAG TPA: alpha-amylase family glycosyl hydrolase [Candidatus Limnocylindrales bacterium]
MNRAGHAIAVQSPRFGDDWWRRGVIYQVYPRSFADSDANGIGDLPGIIDHLDYLGPGGLGVDAIWLSPIYPSPGHDLGYDVSDHGSVDPLFGTEADFDRLIAEAHRRGIRIILDLVLNHTSDQHPWFRSSRSSRQGPFADWYLWRDPAGYGPGGEPLPPNNWVSYFGGPGWQWEPRRKQFYFHTFLTEQPDLDWRTPAVEAAQFAMVRRWLDRGVDGFRLDVFNAFLKHPGLPSNPSRPGTSTWARQVHRYDRDQPDLKDLIGRFRAMVDAFPGRMTVGELFDGQIEQAADLTAPRHLVFDWELLGTQWTAAAVNAALARRDDVFGEDRWPTVVLSNHDQSRHASRLVASVAGHQPDAVAKAAAVLLLTVRGTPFVYYGEEIGMEDVEIAPEESVDPPAARVGPDFAWWDRSRCRTPMPWSDGPGAGFTTGRPWLWIGADFVTRNVAAQLVDDRSVLALYRRLIALRAASPALQAGAFELLPSPGNGMVAYTRSTPDQTILVVLNLARESAAWTVPEAPPGTGWQTALSTHGPAVADEAPVAGRDMTLAPDEARILEAVARD